MFEELTTWVLVVVATLTCVAMIVLAVAGMRASIAELREVRARREDRARLERVRRGLAHQDEPEVW